MAGARGSGEFLAIRLGPATAELERLTRLDDLPVSRNETWHAVASVLLVTVDGRVLLARNRYGWGTVGGHLEEADPTMRAAAAREAMEELGILLDPNDLEPLSVVDDREIVPGCAHWDFCFVLVVAGTVDVVAQSDVTAADWFPLDALPEVNDHMRQHIDALRGLLAS